MIITLNGNFVVVDLKEQKMMESPLREVDANRLADADTCVVLCSVSVRRPVSEKNILKSRLRPFPAKVSPPVTIEASADDDDDDFECEAPGDDAEPWVRAAIDSVVESVAESVVESVADSVEPLTLVAESVVDSIPDEKVSVVDEDEIVVEETSAPMLRQQDPAPPREAQAERTPMYRFCC